MNMNTKTLDKILAHQNQQYIHNQEVFIPGIQRWFKFNEHISTWVQALPTGQI